MRLSFPTPAYSHPSCWFLQNRVAWCSLQLFVLFAPASLKSAYTSLALSQKQVRWGTWLSLLTPHMLSVSKFLLTGAVLFWLPQSQRTFQTLLTNVWLNWADSYLSLIGIGFNEIRISVLTFGQTETHTSNIFISHVLSLPRIVIDSRNITSKVGNM